MSIVGTQQRATCMHMHSKRAIPHVSEIMWHLSLSDLFYWALYPVGSSEEQMLTYRKQTSGCRGEAGWG